MRGTRKLRAEPPVTAGNVGVRPDGLYNVLTRVHREWTDRPLWITENGLALNDYAGPDGRCHDPERIDYFAAHLEAAHSGCAGSSPRTRWWPMTLSADRRAGGRPMSGRPPEVARAHAPCHPYRPQRLGARV